MGVVSDLASGLREENSEAAYEILVASLDGGHLALTI
jgi:hypothetical protein